MCRRYCHSTGETPNVDMHIACAPEYGSRSGLTDRSHLHCAATGPDLAHVRPESIQDP